MVSVKTKHQNVTSLKIPWCFLHTKTSSIRESELVTKYLQPVLAPLFDDLDNNVMLRCK